MLNLQLLRCNPWRGVMSDLMEPQKVHLADIRHWWRESLGLLRRRAWSFSAETLAFYVLVQQVSMLPWVSLTLGLLLCQTFVLVLILTAQAADQSRKLTLTDCLSNIRSLVVYLLLMSVFYTLIFITLLVIGLYMQFNVTGSDYSHNALYLILRWLEPGVVAFEIFYACITVTLMWFFNPLMMLNALTIKDCYVLARKAQRVNDTVVFVVSFLPFFLFYLLVLTTELSVVFAVLALPVFCAMQYVSYRHVFLGLRDNQKQAVSQTLTQPVRSASK